MSTATHLEYEAVIGLEVHVQLKTNAKLFSASAVSFGDIPNQNTDPVVLALPGVLPIVNGTAIEYAIRLGLALHCSIAPVTKFDRKHYFYPDLPKAYQISQYDQPICENGTITLKNGRVINIIRAHMEEDAGKLVHVGAAGLAGADYSLVDLNRAGTPLVEIVSAPDFRSGEEAREYLTTLRQIVRYLDVCDGNMEEGSMRCDANVSIRPKGSAQYGTKTEVKNMNSTRAVERAINVEIERQTQILNSGGRVSQESRLWNEATGETILMRSKEEAHDYRYFPEPDIPPIAIDAAWIEHVKNTMPELPEQRMSRLQAEFGLSEYDAMVLTETKELGDFFLQAAVKTENYKSLTNWLMGDLTGYLKADQKELHDTQLTPEALAEMITLIDSGSISSAQGKKLLKALMDEGGTAAAQVKAKGLVQISDEGALKSEIQKVIDANPDNVAAYRSGKDKLFGFFVGQVMKATQGQANPELVNQLLKELLG